MFKTSVEVSDPGLIEAYEYLLENAQEVVNTRVNRTVNRVRDRLLSHFLDQPGPVVYSKNGKLDWTSDKQRRAFFATNGFGAGIPYQRSGKLVKAWKLIVVYQPSIMTLVSIENNNPVRQFVTGEFQQKYHAITGWYQDSTLIDQAQAELTDAVETDLIASFYAIDEAA